MQPNFDLSELSNVFNFEYFETYSLQRGSEYEKIIHEKEELYNRLIKKTEQSKELELLDFQLNNVQFLFDEFHELHFSAKKQKRFYSKENEAKELIKIFKTKTQNIPSWMCTPIYRDAIVFYDKENCITEVLNICFSCEFIQNSNKDFIDADESVYENLKKLLIEFGHKINSDK
ncbi:hypothetical protein AB4Y90_01730 [Chryseobacterium sp. 2TAF14]|uniref:hypothetical protein n=1 Tax=Chryseobacterium sp. 2TAF14 TaxID=3233007 RepID=UPI003F8F5D99